MKSNYWSIERAGSLDDWKEVARLPYPEFDIERVKGFLRELVFNDLSPREQEELARIGSESIHWEVVQQDTALTAGHGPSYYARFITAVSPN
jgi:hypothetical protein